MHEKEFATEPRGKQQRSKTNNEPLDAQSAWGVQANNLSALLKLNLYVRKDLSVDKDDTRGLVDTKSDGNLSQTERLGNAVTGLG
jgi:hypothetical protein